MVVNSQLTCVLWTTLFMLLQWNVDSAAVKTDARKLFKRSTDQPPTTDYDYLRYLSTWKQIMYLLRTDAKMASTWNEVAALTNSGLYDDDFYVDFTCEILPPADPKPTTVNELGPADINVIGALGDSITAGMGVRAQSMPEMIFSNRGESWSIGGEKDLELTVLTLPNILKKYNPDIKGAATCRRHVNHEYSALNVAVPGATNRGMKAEAQEVMTKMLEDPDIDYYNDWKLITLFIGANDLCQQCRNSNFSADAYYYGVKEALDLFYYHLPRAIINVQPMFDVSVVKDFAFPVEGGDTFCQQMHELECTCGMQQTVEELQAVKNAYFNKLVELTSGRYDLRPDFTVVLQPHLRDFVPPKFPNGTFDTSYIAPDCFHPSAKAHQGFAYMIWNTMFTPVGQKTFNYSLEEPFGYICPSKEKPYIYTNCNSYAVPPSFCSYNKGAKGAAPKLAD